MHDTEIHEVIVAAVRRSQASVPPTRPTQLDGVDDLAVDIMVSLQVAGFEIKKRSR